MKTKVTLTMNEIKRMHLMQKIIDRQMTASEAAELLGLSLRQIRRLVAKYRQHLVNVNKVTWPEGILEPLTRFSYSQATLFMQDLKCSVGSEWL